MLLSHNAILIIPFFANIILNWIDPIFNEDGHATSVLLYMPKFNVKQVFLTSLSNLFAYIQLCLLAKTLQRNVLCLLVVLNSRIAKTRI